MAIDASGRRFAPPGTLFERLRADDEDVSLGTTGLVSERVASVKRNLINILNTRAGSSMSVPALGLGDFNDSAMESSNMLGMVAQEIRRCIVQHEPRISDVAVSFERSNNKGATLHFVIRAQIQVNRRSEIITVDLALLDGRHFQLR